MTFFIEKHNTNVNTHTHMSTHPYKYTHTLPLSAFLILFFKNACLFEKEEKEMRIGRGKGRKEMRIGRGECGQCAADSAAGAGWWVI
jgi:hypothetical protein